MESKTQVLVISPDGATLQAVQGALGDGALAASDVRQAQRLLARVHVDLVCIDSVLRTVEVERLWRWLAAARSGVMPSALLLAPPSAQLSPSTHLTFFRDDRDGVVCKPLVAEELTREVARLAAASPMRRRERAPLRAGPATLDSANRVLFVDGGSTVRLTPTECRLLEHLMRRAGALISSEELLEEVWGYLPGTGGAEVVRAHVSNLRRKLRSAGLDTQIVRTVPYRGYAFDAGGRVAETADDAFRAG